MVDRVQRVEWMTADAMGVVEEGRGDVGDDGFYVGGAGKSRRLATG